MLTQGRRLSRCPGEHGGDGSRDPLSSRGQLSGVPQSWGYILAAGACTGLALSLRAVFPAHGKAVGRGRGRGRGKGRGRPSGQEGTAAAAGPQLCALLARPPARETPAPRAASRARTRLPGLPVPGGVSGEETRLPGQQLPPPRGRARHIPEAPSGGPSANCATFRRTHAFDQDLWAAEGEERPAKLLLQAGACSSR